MIDKHYNPRLFEEENYKREVPFYSKEKEKSSDKNFSIVLPPPNVTGTLHIGHALNVTLQDILVRFKRLCGFNVLWQPGMDHAGIATQIVVENQLKKEGIERSDMTREAFVERVWQWKEESGSLILNQQLRLGASFDLTRSRFTMDNDFSKSVTQAFVDLYKNGLIFKDKRLVNFDPKLQTAISDLEVTHKEVQSSFYFIRYNFADNGLENKSLENNDFFVLVATTRPETIFADVALAIHPDNEKLKHLIGQNVFIPLTNRLIPIIADTYSDPTKGTGIVKITPAHDFNDFEAGKRHKLPMISIIDETAHLIQCDEVPVEFQGQHIKKARENVIKALEENNALDEIKSLTHMVPFSERSDVEVQPHLTDQWYVDSKALSEDAIKAVKTDAISFIPKQWENTYFEWLNNIEPWCISRQIWWGHQIPAWYANGKIYVEETEKLAYINARHDFGDDVLLIRDQDVLDTWFSSALWPLETLDWHKDKDIFNAFYPTSVLVTGFDIIFFWVARMIMFSLYFLKKEGRDMQLIVPFKNVYIHALVRDEKGQKMSKSKGNVVDPLALMDQFGADAVRWTLANLSIPGRDIRLSSNSVEISRNYITKIWNSARFLLINKCTNKKPVNTLSCEHSLNFWILDKFNILQESVVSYLNQYRFDLATKALYHFLWHTYCDLYIEGIKSLLKDDNFKEETKTVAGFVFCEFLKLSYPFIPFVTQRLFDELKGSMIIEESLNLSISQEMCTDLKNVDSFIELVKSVKRVKGVFNVKPSVKIQIFYIKDPEKHKIWINDILNSNLSEFNQDKGRNFPIDTEFGAFYLDIESLIEKEEGLLILQKKMTSLKSDIEKLILKLKNESYRNAKPDFYEEDQKLFLEKKHLYDLMEKAQASFS